MMDERTTIQEQLSAYLDGELSDAERARVEQTLRDSAELREELERLRRVTQHVAGLPHRPAPSGLANRIAAEVRRQPKPLQVVPKRRSRVLQAISVAAVVTLAGLVALVVRESNEVQDATRSIASPESRSAEASESADTSDSLVAADDVDDAAWKGGLPAEQSEPVEGFGFGGGAPETDIPEPEAEADAGGLSLSKEEAQAAPAAKPSQRPGATAVPERGERHSKSAAAKQRINKAPDATAAGEAPADIVERKGWRTEDAPAESDAVPDDAGAALESQVQAEAGAAEPPSPPAIATREQHAARSAGERAGQAPDPAGRGAPLTRATEDAAKAEGSDKRQAKLMATRMLVLTADNPTAAAADAQDLAHDYGYTVASVVEPPEQTLGFVGGIDTEREARTDDGAPASAPRKADVSADNAPQKEQRTRRRDSEIADAAEETQVAADEVEPAGKDADAETALDVVEVVILLPTDRVDAFLDRLRREREARLRTTREKSQQLELAEDQTGKAEEAEDRAQRRLGAESAEPRTGESGREMAVLRLRFERPARP